MENFSSEQILAFADELNSRPHRRLSYQMPEELFEAFLDSVYAAVLPRGVQLLQ